MILLKEFLPSLKHANYRLKTFIKIISFILIVCSQTKATTQSLNVNHNENNTDTFNLEAIRKINVTDGLMNLVLWNGTTYSWNLTSITKLSYNDVVLGNVGLKEKIDLVDFSVYPNPTSSCISLLFSNYKSEEITIQLIDLKGTIISVRHLGTIIPGNHVETISLLDVTAGTYVIRAISPSITVSKVIIKS